MIWIHAPRGCYWDSGEYHIGTYAYVDAGSNQHWFRVSHNRIPLMDCNDLAAAQKFAATHRESNIRAQIRAALDKIAHGLACRIDESNPEFREGMAELEALVGDK